MRGPRTFPIVLAGFTAFLDLYATQPLLPLLARTFHASHFGVSLTITAPTVAVAVAAPLAGRLGDALGHKRVIVGAAAALAVTMLLAATATSLAALVTWRFVQGLFTPGVFAVTIAYIHEQWPSARAGSAIAAYVSGTVLGGFGGRVVAGVMAADVSWPAAFVALGVLNLAAAGALAAWLPPDDGRPHEARPARGALLAHLRNRQLVATYAVGFFVLFTLVATFTYVTFLLAEPPFSLGTAALGSLFVVYLLGAAVTPFAGRWIDRYGHRAALAGAVGVGMIGALLTLTHALGAIALGLALCATGVFIAQATASSHIGVAADHDRGLAVGLYAMFYYAGGSAGGAVPAIFWSAGGWPACVGLVVAGQIATGAAGVGFWADRRGEHTAQLPETGV